MGIVETELAAFELSDGTEVRIEYNKGDVIHLHYGSVRFDLTPAEFDEFATTIGAGLDALEDIKYE